MNSDKKDNTKPEKKRGFRFGFGQLFTLVHFLGCAVATLFLGYGMFSDEEWHRVIGKATVTSGIAATMTEERIYVNLFEACGLPPAFYSLPAPSTDVCVNDFSISDMSSTTEVNSAIEPEFREVTPQSGWSAQNSLEAARGLAWAGFILSGLATLIMFFCLFRSLWGKKNRVALELSIFLTLVSSAFVLSTCVLWTQDVVNALKVWLETRARKTAFTEYNDIDYEHDEDIQAGFAIYLLGALVELFATFVPIITIAIVSKKQQLKEVEGWAF